MKKLFGVQLKKTGKLDESGNLGRAQSSSVIGTKKEEARASSAEAPAATPAPAVASTPKWGLLLPCFFFFASQTCLQDNGLVPGACRAQEDAERPSKASV